MLRRVLPRRLPRSGDVVVAKGPNPHSFAESWNRGSRQHRPSWHDRTSNDPPRESREAATPTKPFPGDLPVLCLARFGGTYARDRAALKRQHSLLPSQCSCRFGATAAAAACRHCLACCRGRMRKVYGGRPKPANRLPPPSGPKR